MMKKKRNIMDFAGLWADMSEEEAERMERNIKDFQEKWNKDFLKKI